MINYKQKPISSEETVRTNALMPEDFIFFRCMRHVDVSWKLSFPMHFIRSSSAVLRVPSSHLWDVNGLTDNLKLCFYCDFFAESLVIAWKVQYWEKGHSIYNRNKTDTKSAISDAAE